MTRIASIFLLLLAPALAGAQDTRHTRKGFGASFGIGGGNVGTVCDNCNAERVGGVVAYLRLGGHVRPNVFLAGESSAWVNGDENVDESLGFVTFVTHWYPNTNGALYLRAGLGVSYYENVVNTAVGPDYYTSNSGTFTFGVGYDIRVGRNFSLTPFAHAFGTGEGEMLIDNAPSGARFSNNALKFGLGLTWH